MIHQTLNSCREAIANGFDNFLQLESHARMKLLKAGLDRIISPFAMPAPCDRSLPIPGDRHPGARGTWAPRLIDNVRLALNPVSDWGMLADGH